MDQIVTLEIGFQQPCFVSSNLIGTTHDCYRLLLTVLINNVRFLSYGTSLLEGWRCHGWSIYERKTDRDFCRSKKDKRIFRMFFMGDFQSVALAITKINLKMFLVSSLK